MRNVLLFFFITFLTGNPILAILIIIAIYLLIDYQYVGVSRSLFRKVRRGNEIRSLAHELRINPNDAAARSDLGRLLVHAHRYPEAVGHLEQAYERMHESEETTCFLGIAYLWTGKPEEGEALIQKALEKNPKFRYGEPYLKWGEYLLSEGKHSKAVEVLEKFGTIHSSSVEGNFLLGEAYRGVGEGAKAKTAYRTALEMFAQSPGYKRRQERPW
ncbi:MAG TPA: tetratricopeptide repeat protein, partial [Nitrospiria bacterium]|nr:tetratricopeptide repeat protein [Nitrospiria bacterium]